MLEKRSYDLMNERKRIHNIFEKDSLFENFRRLEKKGLIAHIKRIHEKKNGRKRIYETFVTERGAYLEIHNDHTIVPITMFGSSENIKESIGIVEQILGEPIHEIQCNRVIYGGSK